MEAESKTRLGDDLIKVYQVPVTEEKKNIYLLTNHKEYE
jgi:hypothetical protein